MIIPFTYFLCFHHTYFSIESRYIIHPSIWIWRQWSDFLLLLYLHHDCRIFCFCIHLHIICYTDFTFVAALLHPTVIVAATIFTVLPPLALFNLHDTSNTILTLPMMFLLSMKHAVTANITMVSEIVLLPLILHQTYTAVSVVSVTCSHHDHGTWNTDVFVINALCCATAIDFLLDCAATTVTILDP